MTNRAFIKIFIVILIIFIQGLILAIRNYYLIFVNMDFISTRLLILMYFILSLVAIKILCDRFINHKGDDNG